LEWPIEQEPIGRRRSRSGQGHDCPHAASVSSVAGRESRPRSYQLAPFPHGTETDMMSPSFPEP
jgi:hypothetical protein